MRRALEGFQQESVAAGASDGLAAVVEQTRQKLQIASQSTPDNNEVRVTFTCATDAPHAATVVNELAQHYADECRAKLQTDAQQALDAAQAARGRARQQALAAKAAMDEYLQNALRKRPSTNNARRHAGGPGDAIPPPAAVLSDHAPTPRTAAGRELRLATNPEWTKLNEQLDSLRARRAEMLSIRTPAHPEVLALDGRIAQTEERLAATRRQTADEPANLPVIVNGPVPSPAAEPVAVADENPPEPQGAAENAAASETYHKLSDALAQANAAVEQLAVAESQAQQEQQQLPLIEVFPASAVAAAASAVSFRTLVDPLGWALAAGLAMALGTGLLLRGMPWARTFATASELHNALSLPVVGVLHETSLGFVDTLSQRP